MTAPRKSASGLARGCATLTINAQRASIAMVKAVKVKSKRARTARIMDTVRQSSVGRRARARPSWRITGSVYQGRINAHPGSARASGAGRSAQWPARPRPTVPLLTTTATGRSANS